MDSPQSAQSKTWSPSEWDMSTISSFTTVTSDGFANQVLSNHTLLASIFKHLEDQPSILTRLARVNKLWHEMAMDVLWRDVSAGGIRPILHILPEYFERNGKPRLKSLPHLASWTPFETGIAPRIDTLHLDLKTPFLSEGPSFLHRRLLQDTFYAAPDHIDIPKLRKLHVTLDLDFLHVDIMRRLSSFAIGHLSLELYSSRDDNNSPSPVETDRLFSLGVLFDFIWMHMPHLLSLRLLLPTGRFLSSDWPKFTITLMKLRRLHTLILPAFALPRALLPALAQHPSLINICAYADDKDLIWNDVHALDASVLPPMDDGAQDMTLLRLPVSLRPPPILLSALSHLTLTTHLRHLSELFCQQIYIPQLKSLHVIPPQTLRATHELRNFFEVVVAKFPDLRSLNVGPLIMTNTAMRIDYEVMKALRGLKGLESLTIKTSTPFEVDDKGFAELVAHWPRLRTLALDDSITHTIPDVFIALLPLGVAITALKKSCPHLEALSILAHPTLPWTPATPSPSLRDLHLRFAKPYVASPEDVARLLRRLCPDDCRLYIDLLPLDSWVSLTESSFEFYTPEDEDNSTTSKQFVRTCMDEWKWLVAADGKEVYSEWSETLKVEMRVVKKVDKARWPEGKGWTKVPTK